MDALRPISDPVLSLCIPEFPDVQYLGGLGFPNNIVHTSFSWADDVVTYSNGSISLPEARKIPQCVLEAEYIINMAILKQHGVITNVTLCGKNYYGLIGEPSALHAYSNGTHQGMESYAPQTDLLGHEHLGGKTMLFIVDGLYGAKGPRGAMDRPTLWESAPFDGGWPSSIFMSQDPVAVDSVCVDFLDAEVDLPRNPDRYLHEAAEAGNPASGTVYDPEGDGTPLESLGVHEHWNNPEEKLYSRNINPRRGRGIELIRL
jgi:hypothetical protein